MWNRMHLRTRIYLLLTALVMITLGGASVTFWYTYEMQRLITTLSEKNMSAFQAAAELEIDLVNQKGFVSYYFLDGDRNWLRQMEEYRNRFKDSLSRARMLTESETQKTALDNIESEYNHYVEAKDRVIQYYSTGKRQLGETLHQEVREHFFNILKLTESLKETQLAIMKQAKKRSLDQAKQLRFTAAAAALTVILLGVFLAFILTSQILGPVRKLAEKTDREGTPRELLDEVKALSRGVDELIENIDHSQSELEKSQEVLLHAEKLTLVGKLAAGTAHSIRNPLTSVKMRLFSLARSPDLTTSQREDLQVISQEINHVDAIVENFLGFSKPPRLKKVEISPSDVIDLSVKLLRHRLESYHVRIRVERDETLPWIDADPELFKEAILNMILNACEAMKSGGSITIVEKVEHDGAMGKRIVIQISDDGPGVPVSIQDQIFQPFFTTKEEGTGLGLSIAARIIRQHGGALDLVSTQGHGATFVITIPEKETPFEQNSHH